MLISKPLQSSPLDDRWRDERFRWLIAHRNVEQVEIVETEEIDLEVIETGSGGYDHRNRWQFYENKLHFDADGMDIWFEMPDGWNFDDTHQDLFRLANMFS